MVAVTTPDGVAAWRSRARRDRPQHPRRTGLLAWGVAIVAPTLAAATVGLHAVNGDIDFTGGWFVDAALAVLLAVPAVLIVAKRPASAVGWLLCVAALTQGLCGLGREYFVYGSLGGSVPGWLWVGWFSDPLWSVTVGALPLMLILFPDGQPRSARSRALIALPVTAFLVAEAGHLLAGPVGSVRGREVTHPLETLVPAGLGATATNLGSSSRWPAWALLSSCWFSGTDARSASRASSSSGSCGPARSPRSRSPPSSCPPTRSRPLRRRRWSCFSRRRSPSPWCAIDCSTSTSSSTKPWVYAALTVAVVGGYAGLVALSGAVLNQPVHAGRGLVVTGLVAVAFTPLRQWLQRVVDRLVYGDRNDPYGVLAQLGRRIDTSDRRAELTVVVDTVTQALKLPYAAIVGPDGAMLAVAGQPRGRPAPQPLAYQGAPVGTLLVEPRTPNAGFSRDEQRLLADLARQIGAAVHAVGLAQDLQASRLRLVAAKENERRRLRRDLHDGLGPTLAGLGLKVDTARLLVDPNPQATKDVLAGVNQDIRATIDDIRRLVYDLRPPALDELGLLGALRECAGRLDTPDGLVINVVSAQDLPELPAAVEVAAYRIGSEAMTNVVRHADARRCDVVLRIGEDLQLSVTDDGVGLATDWRPGVGTQSMTERAAELGGHLSVGSGPGGRGTQVQAQLPLDTDPAAP